jgi:hypothetical protein
MGYTAYTMAIGVQMRRDQLERGDYTALILWPIVIPGMVAIRMYRDWRKCGRA